MDISGYLVLFGTPIRKPMIGFPVEAEPPESSGYGRLPMDPRHWEQLSDGTIFNTRTIVFGPAPGKWGCIAHIGIVDDKGCLKFWTELFMGRVIERGETLAFPPSCFVIPPQKE